MKFIFTAIFLFGAISTGYAQAPSTQSTDGNLSGHLPPYFESYLTFNGTRASGIDHHQENGGDIYVYSIPDKRTSIRIDLYSCEVNVCSALLDSALRAVYPQVTAGGEYDLISPNEVYARWSAGEGEVRRYAFVMPGELLLWTVAQTSPVTSDIMQSYQDGLIAAVNHARFELSEAHGELPFGREGDAARTYAESLLEHGNHEEAVRVLKEVITTTPQDYKAQIDFARNTDDSVASIASAKIVLENAESPELIAAAERILGLDEKEQPPPPPVSKDEGGLRVILVPLGPCDVQIIKDASVVYTQVTGLPVQIRSFPGEWDWGSVDRIPNQRAIQQIIVQGQGSNIDFSNWTLFQYEEELKKLSVKADPITRYRVKQILEAADGQGQYSLASRLNTFYSALSQYKSPDPRTVYIGVTSVNVALGDANFNFWAYAGQPRHKVGLLSYYMLTASQSGQPSESRTRLTQRIAKELVGVSLNILGVPTPSDPQDPASATNSVQRVDEKGLTLSQPTADALAKIRQAN
jgi:predicted Zn-dependent protease